LAWAFALLYWLAAHVDPRDRELRGEARAVGAQRLHLDARVAERAAAVLAATQRSLYDRHRDHLFVAERWLEEFQQVNMKPEVRKKIMLDNAKKFFGLEF